MSINPVDKTSTYSSYIKTSAHPSLLKRIAIVTCIALLFFSGGASLAHAQSPTTTPSKLSFDPTFRNERGVRDNGYEMGLRILTGRGDASLLCNKPIDHFKVLASQETGERGLLAQYYQGRRLACGRHETGPTGMEGSMRNKLWVESENERLKGLSMMYTTGGLKIIYPKKGQSFDQLFRNHLHYEDVASMYYEIDGCYYFTAGTLLCPDEYIFNQLRTRFEIASEKEEL